MLRVVLLLVCLGVSGCRIESVPPESEADPVARADSDRASAPSASRVDAMRTDQGAPVDTSRAPRDVDRVFQAPSGLVVPVVGVGPSGLVDTFEAARSEGRTHNALDILAPRGTPVVAAAAGEVARLFESDKGGLTVYVIGQDRQTVYYYAHLDAWAPGLEAGQRLAAGDAVGTVGDSGNAAPGNTHLHFAVWRVEDAADFWDGEPLNPYELLTR